MYVVMRNNMKKKGRHSEKNAIVHSNGLVVSETKERLELSFFRAVRNAARATASSSRPKLGEYRLLSTVFS